MNPTLMELSGYVNHNVSMDPQYGWRLEITNPDESDLWKAIGSQVRFIHVNTSAAIKVEKLKIYINNNYLTIYCFNEKMTSIKCGLKFCCFIMYLCAELLFLYDVYEFTLVNRINLIYLFYVFGS